jgi:hypothetical protein
MFGNVGRTMKVGTKDALFVITGDDFPCKHYSNNFTFFNEWSFPLAI